MAVRVKNMSKTAVWVILGLLILGLAGFGARNFSGTVRTIGTVGDQSISTEAFARELQREMRAVGAQTGQPMTIAQARALGLDQVTLAKLVQLAALDHEAETLGLSIGDRNLLEEIRQIDAFRGIDGKFDRDAYRYALQNANLSETEFEEDLRAEGARTLVQQALTAGVGMPAAMPDLIADYIGARRSFTWATLDESALPEPIPDPTEAELKSYYEAHQDAFMLPETRKITYVWLTPEMLLDEVEVGDDAVRKLYDDRQAEFEQPERRLVERLPFSDQDAADSAMAQIEAGGATFETLVADRGLQLSDVDLGDVTREDLGAAADQVFAAEDGAVVGPVQSDLGPVLYRVNGRLEARHTPFEDVEAELRDELAVEKARRLIDSRVDSIEDLLAGGATLEEAAQETELELGQIDWTDQSDEGIAAYAGFGKAAAEVAEGDFPQIDYLEDGGIFALRLDEILPPRPEPLADAEEKVAAAWHADQLRAALVAEADKVVGQLKSGTAFTDTGFPHKVENALTRGAFIEGTPADFMSQVFEMEKGEYRVVPADGKVLIVRLDDILPPAENAENTQMHRAISQQLDQALAQALFAAYVRDVRLRARVRIDQQAVQAVVAGFN